jgi:hypothetical protein
VCHLLAFSNLTVGDHLTVCTFSFI